MSAKPEVSEKEPDPIKREEKRSIRTQKEKKKR